MLASAAECFCRTGEGAGLSLLSGQPALHQLCHQKEDGERMECGQVLECGDVLKFSIQLPKHVGGESRARQRSAASPCPGSQ